MLRQNLLQVKFKLIFSGLFSRSVQVDLPLKVVDEGVRDEIICYSY